MGGALKRMSVVSSVIASVGYDAAAKTLEVGLVGGRVYQYFDVADEVYAAFMMAPSKGTFFGANVRDAYRYRRID
jgi:KTSC domain